MPVFARKLPGILPSKRVVVCVFLFENVDELVSREIDALVLRVEGRVINEAYGRNVGNDLARIGIQHDQLAWTSA